MAVTATSWYAIGWVDWVSVGGVPLTLFGLWLAWIQARAAANSAKAAQKAIEYTERRLRANQLLVLIPQLRFIEKGLDEAIEHDDAQHAKRELDNWRWHAGNIYGLLSADGSADHAKVALVHIQKSLGLAHAATGQLIGTSQIPVKERCTRARGSIGKVCDELNTWVSRNASLAQDGDTTS